MNTNLLEIEVTRHRFLLQALGIKEKIPCAASYDEKMILKSILLKEKTEVLFLLGVGVLSCIDEVLTWVNEKTIREVVLLEESLEALNGFLDQPGAGPFLSHERCALRVKMPQGTREEYVKEIAEEFASDSIECAAFGPMSQYLEEYEFQLRKHASFHYFGLQEDMEYHRLVENILGNLKAIKRASLFDRWEPIFEGTTALVCGAGPSLGQYYSILKEAKGKYPIIAGGSAIPLLTNAGITPDLGVAVDPNKTELDRLSTMDPSMPLIFSGRLHPGVLEKHPGETIYYTSQTGGQFEVGIIEALGLSFSGEELALLQSTTIASMCLEIACRLGCESIVLIGFDLAYCNGQRYPKDLPKNFGEVEQLPIRSHLKKTVEKNRNGDEVETIVLWKMERDALGRLIERRENHTFTAMQHDGLVIPGVSFIQELPPQGRPFNERLHAAIMQHKHDRSVAIDGYIEGTINSLVEARAILERILLETEREFPRNPLIDVLLLDLQELDAYEVFLHSTLSTLERLVSRKIYDFKSLNNKCLYIIKLINKYIDILNNAYSLIE